LLAVYDYVVFAFPINVLIIVLLFSTSKLELHSDNKAAFAEAIPFSITNVSPEFNGIGALI